MAATMWLIEHSKTGRAHCKACSGEIPKGALRLGTRFGQGGHDGIAYRHFPGCLTQRVAQNIYSADPSSVVLDGLSAQEERAVRAAIQKTRDEPTLASALPGASAAMAAAAAAVDDDPAPKRIRSSSKPKTKSEGGEFEKVLLRAGISSAELGDVLAKLKFTGIHTLDTLRAVADFDKSTDRVMQGVLKDAGLSLGAIIVLHQFLASNVVAIAKPAPPMTTSSLSSLSAAAAASAMQAPLSGEGLFFLFWPSSQFRSGLTTHTHAFGWRRPLPLRKILYKYCSTPRCCLRAWASA